MQEQDRENNGDNIPLLEDVVEADNDDVNPLPNLDLFKKTGVDLETLREEITGRVNARLEEVLHAASREIESLIVEQLAGRLRTEFQEIIDEVIQEQLEK
ncbi:MAG: hypothetical protein MJA83_07385, partial [Gammaproteobacteria bacterium]|nr:hypothetical protein [Gammaproteobacteria bacterium]